MNSARRRLVLAGIISMTLLATACGSDSASTDATTAPAADVTTTEVTGVTETTADVTTTEAAVDETTTEAPASADTTAGSEVDFSALSGSLIASGATFPKGFYDDAIATLAGDAPDLTVEYGGGGSGKGRSDLQEQVVDFAGTDGVVKDADKAAYKGGDFVYVPTVIAPITMSYNLPDVDTLQLSPTSISAIFQLEVTKWNDPIIAADNPGVTLPDTDIVVSRELLQVPQRCRRARRRRWLEAGWRIRARMARRHTGRRRQQWGCPDRLVDGRRDRLRRSQRCQGEQPDVRFGDEQGRLQPPKARRSTTT